MKRLVSLILILALVFCLVPNDTFADSQYVPNCGLSSYDNLLNGIKSDSRYDVTKTVFFIYQRSGTQFMYPQIFAANGSNNYVTPYVAWVNWTGEATSLGGNELYVDSSGVITVNTYVNSNSNSQNSYIVNLDTGALTDETLVSSNSTRAIADVTCVSNLYKPASSQNPAVDSQASGWIFDTISTDPVATAKFTADIQGLTVKFKATIKDNQPIPKVSINDESGISWQSGENCGTTGSPCLVAQNNWDNNVSVVQNDDGTYTTTANYSVIYSTSGTYEVYLSGFDSAGQSYESTISELNVGGVGSATSTDVESGSTSTSEQVCADGDWACTFLTGIHSIITTLGTLLSSLGTWFINLASSIGGFFINLGTTIGGYFSEISTNFIDTWLEMNTAILNAAADGLTVGSEVVNNTFDSFSFDQHGLTSIIAAPISTIETISTSGCSGINLPLPFVNRNLTLPCLLPIYQANLASVLVLYQTITTGVIAYYVIVKCLALIKGIQEPDNDRLEVAEL